MATIRRIDKDNSAMISEIVHGLGYGHNKGFGKMSNGTGKKLNADAFDKIH